MVDRTRPADVLGGRQLNTMVVAGLNGLGCSWGQAVDPRQIFHRGGLRQVDSSLLFSTSRARTVGTRFATGSLVTTRRSSPWPGEAEALAE
ncbi:MAG: hypothetical protein R3D98_14920 [Candidatus Krumholzibacteriia bacterium]